MFARPPRYPTIRMYQIATQLSNSSELLSGSTVHRVSLSNGISTVSDTFLPVSYLPTVEALSIGHSSQHAAVCFLRLVERRDPCAVAEEIQLESSLVRCFSMRFCVFKTKGQQRAPKGRQG